MYLVMLVSDEALAAIVIQLALAIFSAGVLVATVSALHRRVGRAEDRLDCHEQKISKAGEDIVGLKVHTAYPEHSQ